MLFLVTFLVPMELLSSRRGCGLGDTGDRVLCFDSSRWSLKFPVQGFFMIYFMPPGISDSLGSDSLDVSVIHDS